MVQQVRVGIVGLGAQGRTYAKLLLDGWAPSLQVAALCSPNPRSASAAAHAELAAELGIQLFTDYAELLTSGVVDAVIITTPHYEHPQMAMDAISQGVHVLLEKPAGVYTKQVRRLYEHADAHPEVTLAMMFNQRANPLYADLKAQIDSGEFGALRHTSWLITSWWRPDAYYQSSTWRASWGGEGGGVLVNQAPHQLDLWQWLCGPATRCFARVQFGFRRDIPVEDEVTSLVEFGDAVTGTFSTCTHDLVGTDRLEMLFDRAKVVVDESSRVTIWRYVDDERTIARQLSAEEAALVPSGQLDRSRFWTSETKEYTSKWGEQHSRVMQNFGEHILTGAPLLAPGHDGIHNVVLANGIHLSAWTGKDVDLTDFDDHLYLAELNRRIEAEGKYPPKS